MVCGQGYWYMWVSTATMLVTLRKSRVERN